MQTKMYICLDCTVENEFEPPDETGKHCYDPACPPPGCGYEWPKTIECGDCDGVCVPADEYEAARRSRIEIRKENEHDA